MPEHVRTIVLFEPVCVDGEHAPFNAGLIASVLEVARSAVFAAEQGHIRAVQDVLPSSEAARVEWRNLVLPPRHHYALHERFPLEWRNLRDVARVADNTRASAIIASSATSATLTAVRMQARVGTRRPFGIVLHSMLDQFVRSRRGRALLRWGNSADIRLVVLSQRLRDDVVALIPGLARTLNGVTHPYLFTEAPVTPSTLDPARVTFAFIGNATLSKGFDDFVSLVEQTSCCNARFELI